MRSWRLESLAFLAPPAALDPSITTTNNTANTTTVIAVVIVVISASDLLRLPPVGHPARIHQTGARIADPDADHNRVEEDRLDGPEGTGFHAGEERELGTVGQEGDQEADGYRGRAEMDAEVERGLHLSFQFFFLSWITLL